MKKKLLQTIKYLIFLSIGIFLLYFAFKGINFDELISGLKNANYWWVILALILALCGYISRAYRWNLLIEPMGYKPKPANSFYALMIGYLTNVAVPRIGEIIRCSSLNKTDKIPVDKLFGTVIVERAIDIISLLILLIAVLIIKINIFESFFIEKIFIPIFEKFSSLFKSSILMWTLVFGIIFLITSFIFIFRSKIKNLNFVIKLIQFLKGVFTGIKSVFKMKKRKQFIFHTIFIWLMYLLMTYVVFFAIDPTSDLTIADGLFIVVIGGIGMSVPVQGGFGAFHLIVASGLALYPNILYGQGLLFATITHESQTIFAILLGGFSIVMIFIINESRVLGTKKVININ